jgi:hypothetical protein
MAPEESLDSEGEDTLLHATRQYIGENLLKLDERELFYIQEDEGDEGFNTTDIMSDSEES